jgi:hypothetical protein
MTKKIIILISLLAIAFGVVFVFFRIRQRSLTDNEPKKIINELSKEEGTTKTDLEEDKNNEDSPESTTEIQESLDPVSKSDCEEECASYDTEKYRVACIEECELTNVSREESDCEKLSGTNKDSCWKEKAVKENKFEYCDNIGSSSIKKSCKDRLTENILESQQSL